MSAGPLSFDKIYDLIDADVAGNEANGEISHNGMAVTFDVMAASCHILAEHKLGLANDGKLSLDRTLAIYFAPHAVDNVVPCTTLNVNVEIIGTRIAQFSVMKLLNGTDWEPVIRKTDVIPAASFDEHLSTFNGINDTAKYMKFIRVLLGTIIATEGMAESLAYDSKNVVCCMIANGVHRAQNEGHNWYTKKAKEERSLTARSLAIAGATMGEFKSFMTKGAIGHDLWHFLDDSSLDEACLALTSHVPITKDVAYNGINHLHAPGNDSDGNPKPAPALSDILHVSDSAKDRYPPGALGRAAILVGLEYVVMMVQKLATKLNIAYAADMMVAATNLRKAFADKDCGGKLKREDLLTAKASLTYAICMAFGFKYGDPNARINAEPPAALEKFAATNAVPTAMGEALYDIFKNMATDRNAAKATVVAALKSLADSLLATVTMIGADAATQRLVRNSVTISAEKFSDFEIPTTDAERSAAAAAKSSEQMQDMFMAMRGAKGSE